jgi:uncharacterized protein (UPF0335 family)
MRVKKVSFENKESLMIFITSLEREEEEIKKQIAYYRKLYKEVSIFVSGNGSMEKALKTIILEKK